MTKLAIASNAHFRVSRLELERDGPSYAFDTVRQFQEELGDETRLFFIAGADSMSEILTWHRAAELLQSCRFIGFSRLGYDLQEVARVLAKHVTADVTWLEVPGLHISSRDLRNRVKNGWPIRYLVPETVEREIRKRDLYREQNG